MAKAEQRNNPSWHSPPKLWSILKPLARSMRKLPTRAEKLLWQRLRKEQWFGCKFRRQQVIEGFIFDFYCAEATLIIEVDGDIHNGNEAQDQWRQSCLEGKGLRVIRFRNEEIMEHLPEVMAKIKAQLN
jgi:very-short-patch-repair endonuclease